MLLVIVEIDVIALFFHPHDCVREFFPAVAFFQVF